MTDNLPKPALPRRLTAIFYDLFLVIPIIAAALAIGLAVQVSVAPDAGDTLHPAVAQVLVLVSTYGFFIIFWLKQGQTLGMQAWRIQLVSSDGQPLRFSQTLVRCVAATLSAACFGLGYLWCLIDKNGHSWHDRLSRSELVLLAKREAAQQKS